MTESRLFHCDGSGKLSAPQEKFDRSGEYKIIRGSDRSIRYSIKASFNECTQATDKELRPVCMIFPGFRMRGTEGGVCRRMLKALQERGLPSLIFDYTGLVANSTDEIDNADMRSMIMDAEECLPFLGDRKTIYIGVSYGINIAMQVLTRAVRGVIGVSCAPDILQRHIVPHKLNDDYKAATAETGFARVHFDDGSDMKITRGFFCQCSEL